MAYVYTACPVCLVLAVNSNRFQILYALIQAAHSYALLGGYIMKDTAESCLVLEHLMMKSHEPFEYGQ